MATPIRLYMVGGAVRDWLDPSNSIHRAQLTDFDFAVEALDYGHMRMWLSASGAKFWQERPQYGTIRCSIPVGALGGLFGGVLSPPDLPGGGKAYTIPADFVLCRRDGFYSDSRHPDAVVAGSLADDLARRDFTVNAMALTPSGEVIDPHMGQYDLRYAKLQCVGNTPDRLNEDPLRIVRALRFAVTKRMELDHTLAHNMEALADRITNVSEERIQHELERTFRFDTLSTLALLCTMPKLRRALFTLPTLWLLPTMKEK